MTNTKCLTAVCADARSFFDPQTLHRQLLHVVLCRSNFYEFFLQGISIRPQHSIPLKYWHKDKLKYWHKYKLKLWHKCIFKMWQKYKLKSWHRYKYKPWQIQNAAVQWLCWPWSWSDAARMQPGSRVERAGKLATNTKIHKYINTNTKKHIYTNIKLHKQTRFSQVQGWTGQGSLLHIQKYTNIYLHKYTNTQIHKDTNTQIHK